MCLEEVGEVSWRVKGGFFCRKRKVSFWHVGVLETGLCGKFPNWKRMGCLPPAAEMLLVLTFPICKIGVITPPFSVLWSIL